MVVMKVVQYTSNQFFPLTVIWLFLSFTQNNCFEHIGHFNLLWSHFNLAKYVKENNKNEDYRRIVGS